jgi:hypothetical protein
MPCRLEPVTADTFIEIIDPNARTNEPTDPARHADDAHPRGAALIT